jgi:hypothetical protein
MLSQVNPLQELDCDERGMAAAEAVLLQVD